jgi:hypothetical protein
VSKNHEQARVNTNPENIFSSGKKLTLVVSLNDRPTDRELAIGCI